MKDRTAVRTDRRLRLEDGLVFYNSKRCGALASVPLDEPLNEFRCGFSGRPAGQYLVEAIIAGVGILAKEFSLDSGDETCCCCCC